MFFVNYGTILTCAAIVPAIYLMVKVYNEDKLEKEPKKLLLTLALLGAVSTFLAAFTESYGSAYIASLYDENSFEYRFLMYFVVVAVSEEGFKYLFLRFKTWNSKEFNCRFDGIVYAVFVSLGFALFENISYVFSYGLNTAIVRALTAIPGHASFGVFMGCYYGRAKYRNGLSQGIRSGYNKIKAILIPVILHGTYDFLATDDSLIAGFLCFIIIMFIWAKRLVKKSSENDRYIDSENIHYMDNGQIVYMNDSYKDKFQ